jgi:hypothetical protein
VSRRKLSDLDFSYVYRFVKIVSIKLRVVEINRSCPPIRDLNMDRRYPRKAKKSKRWKNREGDRTSAGLRQPPRDMSSPSVIVTNSI